MYVSSQIRSHNHTITLASHTSSQALTPYHQHVDALALRPPVAAHPHHHYLGLRRLVKRLRPGVRTLQVCL